MNKILTFALLLGTAVSFSSCNDWLELKPESSMPADEYWQSESDVKAAMTGIYAEVRSSALTRFIQSEMMADAMISGLTSTEAAFTQIKEGNITSTNILCQWASYYKAINQCNMLLDYADKALQADPSFTVKQCEIYKAQARVIRAWMYFYLIRLWKDVPYVTEAYYNDEKARDCAVSSQMEILNALIADLEAVRKEGYLPFSYSNTSEAANKGQATMYFLYVLLADMYRMQGAYATDQATQISAYQNCVTLCNSVIESGQFALVPVYKTTAENTTGLSDILLDAQTHADSCFYVLDQTSVQNCFNELYVKGNSAESIFELQAESYEAVSGFWSEFVNGGRPYMMVNKTHLTDDWFTATQNNLASYIWYHDVRRTFSFLMNQDICWKIGGSSTLSMDYIASRAEYVKNINVYRLADVYLLKAEALNQLAWLNGEDINLLSEAYMSVFKVRDRACATDATDLGTVTIDYWNQLNAGETPAFTANDLNCASMEQFILEEEARESVWEGKRWFDLLRHAERQNANAASNINYLLNQSIYSAAEGKYIVVRTNWLNAEKRYLPYPHQDVLLNELLDQKPAYGVE